MILEFKRPSSALLFVTCWIVACSSGIATGATDVTAVITTAHAPNSVAQQSKPYVILVSLDEFRFDYAAKYGATHLLEVGSQGITAEGLVPSYPSLTFPNHYSIVTGLYPEHHGIVGMTFYDPTRHKHFSFKDPSTATDGSWYQGTPLWTLAEKQGMRTACFFWPGSEAQIDGARPTYYIPFDDKFPDEARIEQVLNWLRLPVSQRPHFITLYYSNVDHAGHNFGPDSHEVADSVHRVDELIGQLQTGLKKLLLPIDLIVVSDHGMATEEGAPINLDKFADLSGFETDGAFLYAPDESHAQAAYQHLSGASSQFSVYRRQSLPPHLHFDESDRIGDPVVVSNGPYVIRAHGDSDHVNKGVHGYDPERFPEMQGIFYASGPGIRKHVRVAPFENVEIYAFIANLLGLKAGKVDGSGEVLGTFLVPMNPELEYLRQVR